MMKKTKKTQKLKSKTQKERNKLGLDSVNLGEEEDAEAHGW